MTIWECLAYVAVWSLFGPGNVVMTRASQSQAPVRSGQTAIVRVAGVEPVTPLA